MITTNFYGLQGDEYVKNGIAIECKQAKNLINCINQVLENKEEISERVDKFLKESLYNTDGKASERLSNLIINVLPQDRISK